MFFQIALSKLHCLRYRTKENNRSNSTQNIFIHSQTYTRRRQYSNKINVNIQRNIVGIMESQITSGLANKLSAITNPTLPRTNSPCRKQIPLIQRSLHWHVYCMESLDIPWISGANMISMAWISLFFQVLIP